MHTIPLLVLVLVKFVLHEAYEIGTNDMLTHITQNCSHTMWQSIVSDNTVID